MLKAIQSRIINIFNLTKSYIRANVFISLIASYVIFSVLIDILFAIDIQIPCVWKTFLGINCPGCGLTTSFKNFITLDFSAAYGANPLLFFVLPIILYCLYIDFLRFKRKLN